MLKINEVDIGIVFWFFSTRIIILAGTTARGKRFSLTLFFLPDSLHYFGAGLNRYNFRFFIDIKFFISLVISR